IISSLSSYGRIVTDFFVVILVSASVIPSFEAISYTTRGFNSSLFSFGLFIVLISDCFISVLRELLNSDKSDISEDLCCELGSVVSSYRTLESLPLSEDDISILLLLLLSIAVNGLEIRGDAEMIGTSKS